MKKTLSFFLFPILNRPQRKALIFSIFLLFFSFLVKAQKPIWANGIGGTNYDVAYAVTHDKYGNIYTTGYFSGTVDFDPGPAVYELMATGNDPFILKQDSVGNFLWAIRFAGNGNDFGAAIVVDSASYIYTLGYFDNWFDADPGSGTAFLSLAQQQDSTYIIKLDSAGNYIWGLPLPGGPEKFGNSLALDDSSNVLITGSFSQVLDFDPGPGNYDVTPATFSWPVHGDSYILKLDSAGHFRWVANFPGAGYAITTDAAQNVYATGMFRGAADFDPGPGVFTLQSYYTYSSVYILKLDGSGNFVWAKSCVGTDNSQGNSIALDNQGNVLMVGSFLSPTDFDPGAGVYSMVGGWDATFILKLDNNGDFSWARMLGGSYPIYAYTVDTDQSGNVYFGGKFHGTIDLDPGPDVYYQTTVPGNYKDIYFCVLEPDGDFVTAERIPGNSNEECRSISVIKKGKLALAGSFDDIITLNPAFTFDAVDFPDILVAEYFIGKTEGRIYNDLNGNCVQETGEIGLSNRRGLIYPGNIVVETDAGGMWKADTLAAGNYTIVFDTSGHWTTNCPTSINFTVTDPQGFTSVPAFGLMSTQPCAGPDVSVTAPFLRPCLPDQQIYVQACNLATATGILSNGYVQLKLDTLLSLTSVSLPYADLGNNLYQIDIGTLNPGACIDFYVSATVSCNVEIGQTLCMKASLFPADSCVFDSVPAIAPPDFTPCALPWDKSSLHVDGWCQNDSIYFVITNSGTGDMDCYSPVRLYIDGQYIWLDSILLNAGESDTLVFAGDGRTWRLEADQHPLHPGNSHPNATIELCGNSSNWTPDLVNILPPDDADAVVDIYCALIRVSFDPNDKTGFPLGVGPQHSVIPNGQFEYIIRFQNTGNDTAFKIVVRDTLDANLDIFSVVSGAASHPYSFRMYGPRVLEWTFENILLPDSTTNEPGSHGFVTFSVKQVADLSHGSVIENAADIYFDFNEPVITNTSTHTVNYWLQQAGWTETDTIASTACGEFVYNGISYNQSGTYWQISSGSADTLVVVDATINASSVVAENGIILTAINGNASYQWLNCTTYQPIAGATNQIFTATANGNYAVIVTENGCSDTSACYAITTVGIKNNLAGLNISVVPNPTNGKIDISTGRSFENLWIEISDITGRIVAKDQKQNTDHFSMEIPGAEGLYFVTITNGKGLKTVVKVVKQ